MQRFKNLSSHFKLANSVVNFFLWIFRQTFVVVILTAMIGFLSLTMLFALFIWIAGVYNPECVGGVDFETNGNNYFTDAFILSWTTFATVVSVIFINKRR